MVGTVQVHADVQVFTQQMSIQPLQCGRPGPGPGHPAVNMTQALELPASWESSAQRNRPPVPPPCSLQIIT